MIISFFFRDHSRIIIHGDRRCVANQSSNPKTELTCVNRSPPPPPQHHQKKKDWHNCRFVSLKTLVKSRQNRSLNSEICPENFREIGFFLTIVFRRNYIIKVLDLVAFFSPSPHFFPFTNVNTVQS